MFKYFGAYTATLIVVISLDLLWLGVIAKSIYRQGIGHLMAEQPNFGAAAAFYLIYTGGLMLFAVTPRGMASGWGETLIAGALFGLVAYATYDLTNLATLKNWPISITLMDIAWGCFISTAAAAAGKAALDRLIAS